MIFKKPAIYHYWRTNLLLKSSENAFSRRIIHSFRFQMEARDPGSAAVPAALSPGGTGLETRPRMKAAKIYSYLLG
jgi:hypothetical protein